MEYKIIKKITGEELYKHNPPERDFDEFVREFGFFNEVGVELLSYIKEHNHQCWFEWLGRRGFIENRIEWNASKIKVTMNNDEIFLAYNGYALMSIEKNGSIVTYAGANGCGLPMKLFDGNGRLKIKGGE